MSTSSSDSIFSFGATRISVSPGATNGVLIRGGALENSTIFKMLSGGTLEILNVTEGATLSAAQLAAAVGTGYPMDVGEKLAIDGSPWFYVISTGATSVAARLTGKTQGTS